MSYFILHLFTKQGMQRMVIKQIRNGVQRELTYIPDQCPLLGLVHRLHGSRPFTWKFSS